MGAIILIYYEVTIILENSWYYSIRKLLPSRPHTKKFCQFFCMGVKCDLLL